MITRKIKIGNFFYHFHSIQNIAHHSQSLFDGVISEGGGVCMSFFVNKPCAVIEKNNRGCGCDTHNRIAVAVAAVKKHAVVVILIQSITSL